MKIKVNWTKDKPTVPGYYHVINVDRSPELFIRWVVPGDNDHLDEWYAAIGTPEPPREPARVEMVGVVYEIGLDWVGVQYSGCNRTFVYAGAGTKKLTIGSHVRIIVEEVP